MADGARRHGRRGNAGLRGSIDRLRQRTMTSPQTGKADLGSLLQRAHGGGAPKYHQKLAEQGKLFVRERLRLLLDAAEGSPRTGCWRARSAGDLPADGVVTGVGTSTAGPSCVMANDSTVKAGSWGARTVEKIIRIIELARRHEHPDRLPGRLGRRADHRPGRTVPGPARRGRRSSTTRSRRPARCPRSAACSARAPRAARTSPRSATSCSWSRATPRCTWARRAWPRGHRRAGDARGDGRGADALRGLRLRRPAGADDKAAIEAAQALPLLLPAELARASRPDRGGRRPARRSTRRSWSRRTSDGRSTCTRWSPAWSTTASFFEIKPASRASDRRPGRIDGRAVGIVANQPEAEGRRAVRRLGRQGGAVRLAAATRSTSRCCSWPTCRAS